jgi:hypothetical protein
MVDFFYNFSGLTFSMVDFLQGTQCTVLLLSLGEKGGIIFSLMWMKIDSNCITAQVSGES